jgi:hypothetical protein
VAATDAMDATSKRSSSSTLGGVLMAALALPGLAPQVAQAENAPEHGQVGLKYLHYQDSQPGLKRVGVDAYSANLLLPIGSKWSLEATAVNDAVSGASPRYYTAISGASKMNDNRTAVDAKLTHYRERSAYGLSLSHSAEHDYISNAAGFDARFSSDDNNTTVNVGLGLSRDEIDSVNNVAQNERKRSQEFLLGMTQALTRTDLLQVNLSYAWGKGYYNDPYKFQDTRPDQRHQAVLLARWNHHFEELGTTLRSSYRYYRDDWGVRAHTFGAEWVQPLSDTLMFTPGLRYYSQSSANFYYDAGGSLGPDLPPLLPSGTLQTADQRLAAFGGITVDLKLDWRFAADWSADVKGEYIEQRTDWRLGGKGSPGLDPFRATSMQLGLVRRF